jgi:hypothetical protein
MWANEQARITAVKRAKSKIGLNYNYTGLIGLDTPNIFTAHSLPNPPQNPLPHVVKPGQMYH